MGDHRETPGIKGTWERGRRELGLMVEGRGGRVLEGHWGGGCRGWNNRKGSSGSKGDAVGEGECRVTRGDTGWRAEEGWESRRKEASRAWDVQGLGLMGGLG